MYKLKITIPLPYRLNILDFPEMDYSELNIENPKYLDSKLKIGFRDDINYKTKLIIEIVSENEFTDDRINRFPIMESRKIINIFARAPIPEVINIGNPEPVTVSFLADRFQIAMSRPVGVTFLPQLPHEPKYRCPDISLAESFLDWTPKYSLDDAIRMIVEEEVMV